MPAFTFENLAHATTEEIANLSDCYFDAKIIDSPRDTFANLPKVEQDEILALYRNGKFLKILESGELIGTIGHGVKPATDTIMISYIFLPQYRGQGLFGPMINAFEAWCLERYPGKRFFRANTEKSNQASIVSLQRAGFEFLEERLEGPDDLTRVPFRCFIRKFAK